ncbi:MAG: ATP-binding protein, partial [Tagaea sp.]
MPTLPEHAKTEDLEPLLASLQSVWQSGLPDAIRIDGRRLTSIDPTGAVALAIALDHLAEQGARTDVIWPPPTAETLGPFAQYDATLRRDMGTASSAAVFPVARVTPAQSLDLIENGFSPWLAARLGLSNAALEPVRTFIKELFRNIEDHAGVAVGYLAVRHSPELKRVEIAIGDHGVGIPYQVRRKEPVSSDGAALARAFDEGFTTKSKPGNAGAGLDWLRRVVIEKNRGALTVFSGHGRLHVTAADEFSTHAITERQAGFPGVLYSISLRTDTIEPV